MAVSSGLLAGRGSTEDVIGPQSAEELLSAGIERWDLSAKRVLVIVPDGTRTAPIPLHAAPPAAVPPGDSFAPESNRHGFRFDQLACGCLPSSSLRTSSLV